MRVIIAPLRGQLTGQAAVPELIQVFAAVYRELGLHLQTVGNNRTVLRWVQSRKN